MMTGITAAAILPGGSSDDRRAAAPHAVWGVHHRLLPALSPERAVHWRESYRYEWTATTRGSLSASQR